MAATDSRRRRAVETVLAVDGGDSKTDVALVDKSGSVLAALRWARSSHLGLGHHAGLESLSDAVAALARAAGRSSGTGAGSVPGRRLATVGVYCMAGVDFAADERRIGRQLRRREWSDTLVLRNDTFAVLRGGSRLGWGIGVVCGAGLNCVGAAPNGRTVRFASLGEISGDLAAGGGWLGVAAIGATVRAADGRGPHTALERAIADHFEAPRATAVMERIYTGDIPESRTLELAPLVFDAAAAGDAVARGLTDQLADEIVAMVVAAARRLRLTHEEVDVVLGGGVFRTHDALFFERLATGIHSVVPKAAIRRLDTPPVLGAALIGLDQLGASPAASARVRASLTQARLASSVAQAQAHHAYAKDGR